MCLEFTLTLIKVLDVGCGIGGSAFFMASHFGAEVYGIDLSSNMISIAGDYRKTRSPAVRHRTQFYIEDATTMEYPEDFYDVVYSRDTILHIDDKLALFKKFYKTLKPGGILLISDYCQGEGELSQVFKNYVKGRGYVLKTVPEYGKVIERAGFGEVRAEDVTKLLIDTCENELDAFMAIQDEVVEEFSQKDFDEIKAGWEEKIGRAKSGDQRWGLFVAKKLFV